jgi:hypothetical protein
MGPKEQKFWNPYLGGVALGLVLLAAFVFTGNGLGASGAVYRVGVAALNTVAPAALIASLCFSPPLCRETTISSLFLSRR